jgi:hypothetical protein
MDYALWLNNHLLRKASAFEPLISWTLAKSL